jgi:sulfite exporter TauE/SafE
VLALGVVKRFLLVLAGVFLLLLGLAWAIGATVATITAFLPSAWGRFSNLLMLPPAACAIIMAAVLFRMARD